MSTSSEDFNTLSFEKQLTSLKDTQESIESLSNWCIQRRQHHKKIVASWLNVLKRAKVEQRLTLFHLANDVIQNSKRKNYEFVESWGTTLQKATPLVRDDKVKQKILRVFRIWEERQIYDDEFLTDLTGLLSVNAGKQTDLDPNDFQVVQLVNKIKQCTVLEADTESQLKQVHECSLPLKDIKRLYSMLKERRNSEVFKKDLDDGILKLEGYVCSLQKELVARAALCQLLDKAQVHYTTQRGEVKVVANAYKNFGNRVKGLKRKLDELCKELPSNTKSPIPSPPSLGEPVPSPGPDEDLELPSGIQDNNSLDNKNSFSDDIEKNLVNKDFSSFVGNADFSFLSFRNNSDTFLKKSEKSNKIEVINSRNSETEISGNINSLLNSLISTKPPPPITNNEPAYSMPLLNPPPPPPPLLPGLDLVNSSGDTIDSTQSSCPPMNFYGSIATSNTNSDINISSDSYNNTSREWSNIWDTQTRLPIETPESPPPREQLTTQPPPMIIGVPPPVPDVDHRQLISAPPPIIPPTLLKTDDVDHRRLPPLPTVQPTNDKNRNHKIDVDHRNLISLTGSLPPPLPPPIPPITPWTPRAMQSDQDYRKNEEFSNLIPPPLPPAMPPQVRRMPLHTDNVESIDMEMSDEENLDSHDDEYSRMMKLESSMARIHGHPPLPRSHPSSAYRNSEGSNNTLNQNEITRSRTNLVRINSNEDFDSKTKSSYLFQREDNERSSLVADIFSDFPNNAMNPQNPNVEKVTAQSDDSQRDDDWEKSDDEGIGRDAFSKWDVDRVNKPPPLVTNFATRNRPSMYNRPPPNFRRPPPLLTTPSFEEQCFNPHNSRGNGNFRRPRGHRGPPRASSGYW